MATVAPEWLARLRDPADLSATDDFASVWLPVLSAFLCRLGLTNDESLVVEAAGTAIIDFVKAPDRFDPAKRSLEGYLRMAAKGDLLNAIARERKHHAAQIPVEVDQLPGKESEGESLRLEDFPDLVAVRESLSEADRAAFDLMLAGVRATAAYVGPFGLEDRPPDEQAAGVKKGKERILKRFQRAARPPEES